MDTGVLDPGAAHAVARPENIFDRGAAQAELAEITAAGDGGVRARALQALRARLDAGRREIRRRFETEREPGSSLMRATAFLVDEVVRTLYAYAVEDLRPAGTPSTGERIALVATGGYGRGELAPHSDIDLLFLAPYKLTPHNEQVVEEILYLLWDLGFRVGHATRSLDECVRHARGDVTIRTSLLEARHVAGDAELTEQLNQRFAREVQAGTAARFIEAKLKERDARHKRMGDSRYQLEPNIKEGKGGLRDLNTLFWIAKDVYRVAGTDALVRRGVFTEGEAKRFAKAQTFLWTVRFHLHELTGRAEERLTFDLQKEIAPRMGYLDHAGASAVERFMKHYYLVAKDVGDLTRILCAHLETHHGRRSRFRPAELLPRRSVDGFQVKGDRLSVRGPHVFRDQPAEMLRIFAVAHARDLDIHPTALRWIRQHRKQLGGPVRRDPTANGYVRDLICAHKDPASILRRMNEAGVLGRFLPEFGRVVAQMQYNMYHHYTVDEHTLFALSELNRIERGELAEIAPIATEVIHKVHSRRALYIAVFLHDLGKSYPGDHSEVGARLARRMGPRLGLTAEETETVAWLVEHHLDMPQVAFKRDLEEPQTIRDFAATVQSLERLRLLVCLTVADIRAVGPNVWTDWKAALLRDLFWNTEDELSGGFRAESRDTRVRHAKDDLTARLSDWSPDALAAHLSRPYPAYWLAWDAETHERHARLVHEADASGRHLTVDTRVDGYRGVTEVTVYTADHPGLFSRIAGALAVAGASITGARIFTLTTGMALDTLWVTDANGGPFDDPEKLAALPETVERTLAGRIKPMQELAARRTGIPSRYAVFTVPPRVFVDNNLAPRHTVIEVDGRDRPGLLHELTQTLTRLNLMIHQARIATYGERVVDVFYVEDVLGGQVSHDSKIKRIRERLIAVLEGDGASDGRRGQGRVVVPIET
ncbi:UTP--GlnB (protein PII) uridylyltransferase, GlnD [Limimonas halophila]|uniref:Bifunctional uridylyltransferase/uridylyl-removing enzyme n=1 Tax=Limimonas halophila TaxID=1082479 RepID=A0A1G7S5P3_9PROT|nr:[protein-PII] uridylyltransferase [Limimonas halophila]SDG18318.1 UTP--GlnB (protein PII) uridylyltransferase, GlnD [Limimonas halophila]